MSERITEPGLYDLSNADYHAQTEWYGSTQLKRELPELTDPDDQAVLDFGNAFHERTLGVGDGIVTVDACDWRTKAAREEAAEARAAGKVAILPKDVATIDRMVESIHRHREASTLLFGTPGTTEESAFWRDPDGIQHRARFDKRIPGALVDLKSTSAQSLAAEDLAKVVADYLYDLSAAHYLAVAEGLELEAEAFALVFVSKHPPHHVAVCDLDEAFLAQGRALRARALDLARNGQRGYFTLTPPRWRSINQEIPA